MDDDDEEDDHHNHDHDHDHDHHDHNNNNNNLLLCSIAPCSEAPPQSPSDRSLVQVNVGMAILITVILSIR